MTGKNPDYFYSATIGEQKDNATGWFSFLSCCFLSTELKNKSALSENQWNARGSQYALDRMLAQRAKSTCAFDTAEMEREYQRKAPLFLQSHILPRTHKAIYNNRNPQNNLSCECELKIDVTDGYRAWFTSAVKRLLTSRAFKSASSCSLITFEIYAINLRALKTSIFLNTKFKYFKCDEEIPVLLKIDLLSCYTHSFGNYIHLDKVGIFYDLN